MFAQVNANDLGMLLWIGALVGLVWVVCLFCLPFFVFSIMNRCASLQEIAAAQLKELMRIGGLLALMDRPAPAVPSMPSVPSVPSVPPPARSDRHVRCPCGAGLLVPPGLVAEMIRCPKCLRDVKVRGA